MAMAATTLLLPPPALAPRNPLLGPSNPLLGLLDTSLIFSARLRKFEWSHLHFRSSLEEKDCKPEDHSALSRRNSFVIGTLLAVHELGIFSSSSAEAVSSSRRALRSEKIPESEYKSLPSGLKYYDLKIGGGPQAVKGSRVAIHYVAKFKGVTFMTSRQGMGVTGGTPYGFDVGSSERGGVLKGLDQGVQGMQAGGQRVLKVPPELAYGEKGVQEIPPNATLEFDVELLSVKQSPFGSTVKLIEG